MKIGIMRKAILIVGGVFYLSANAAAMQPVVAGTDYTLITTPVPKTKEPAGKVNVKLFYSFTCVHCRDLEPSVDKTLAKNKKIDLQRIHVAWDPTTTSFAKISATYELMKLNLYLATFNAVFARQDLSDPAVLKDFLTKNGMSKDQISKFMDNYNSFTIGTQISEYKNLMSVYDVSGTPTFVVADTYMVKPALPDRLIEVVDFLVNKAASGK